MSVSISEESNLNDIINKLGISEEAKKKAIDAAADVYGKALIQNTRDAVVTPSKNKKTHVWEDVSYKKDQYPDHSVDVGFNKYGYYYRFINNGTKYIHGKHFVEHTYDSVNDEMQKVMRDSLLGSEK